MSQIYSLYLNDNSWPLGFSPALTFSHYYLRKLGYQQTNSLGASA